MKRNILIFTFLLIALSINAQKKWYTSIVLGPMLNQRVIDKNYYNDFPNAYDKTDLGLTSGIDFYRIYKNNVFFKTGLRYMLKSANGVYGFKLDENEPISYIDYDFKESFINLPLLLGYKFNIKNQQFYISGGLELNYMFHYNFYSSAYGRNKQYTNSIYNISGKFVFGLAYLYKLNDKFTLMINPEYAQAKLLDEIGVGDYIQEWRLNFGVIFNLP